ncbi:magnesium/cobalt transporter CorA [Plebeiibacterium sediminum]|uniref:Magnesium transport protein CorA n=1 Tax=Plebeiibacterium sediminum TaxID=2992112 RepID=A0AAE3M161_9BACT|nr:magnesium/cobalt transporter CorA [Plebeiobacterium sediminum]MCW3785381.1 magnesium/cobalt transporter CorA [Plebeiobacterium sediminum]
MARFLKSKKELIGISPDDILFKGEQKVDKTRLRLIDYNLDEFHEMELNSINETIESLNENNTSWINIDGLHDTSLMKEISSHFNIENYIIAEVLETHKRPKIHDYDDYIMLSTKMLQYNAETEKIFSENLSIIFNNNTLISFQERVGDFFDPVRERIRKNRRRIRNSGPDYLAFALLDIVVDNYIHTVSLLGEKIEELDDELIRQPSTDNLEKINKYKVEVSYLRKTIKPCREMILGLCKLDSELISDQIQSHLHELQNNIELANESIDNYRDILSDQLNIFHTTVAYKLNDILKFLTIFSVIFIPITFIAGIYGTNFDYIPELHYKYSYFIMWGAILSTVIVMITYFKRKKWF